MPEQHRDHAADPSECPATHPAAGDEAGATGSEGTPRRADDAAAERRTRPRPAPEDLGDEAPSQRSHYAVTRQNTSLRNGLWALGVMFVIVIVVGVLFVGVGNEPKREVPESNRVDVSGSAERASSLAPFPLAVPEAGEAWSPRSARYADDGGGRWSISYTSPSGRLVTLTQAGEVTPALIQDAVPGGRGDGEVAVEGLTCETYAGEAEDGTTSPQAIVCPGQGWAFVVSGQADRAELEALAGAAARSLEG